MSNGLRFEVEEIAIYAVAPGIPIADRVGERCSIAAVGPFSPGMSINTHGHRINFHLNCDYLILFEDGMAAAAIDFQLRKLNPPAEPASLTRREEIGEVV